MVKVKPESEIKTNYEASTALVPARYEAGVRMATWQMEAKDGQALYEAQMARPEILARRERGIDKVSDSEWRADTITKGKPIIGARMKAASDKQVSGFRPYREALVAVDLPPREVSWESNVENRLKPIIKALVDTKEAQGT